MRLLYRLKCQLFDFHLLTCGRLHGCATRESRILTIVPTARCPCNGHYLEKGEVTSRPPNSSNACIWMVEQVCVGLFCIEPIQSLSLLTSQPCLDWRLLCGRRRAQSAVHGIICAGKLDRLIKAFGDYRVRTNNIAVTTGSAAAIPLETGSIDYIFTDPPFGENIDYAELNFLVEAWHGVMTDAQLDAIVDRSKENVQHKNRSTTISI